MEARNAEADGKGRESPIANQSRNIVATLVGLGSEAELFHDTVGDGYARVDLGGHMAIYRLRSRPFKNWLAHQLWKSQGKAPSSEQLSSAINVLEAKARHEERSCQLYNRVAPDPEGGFWYDLSDERWRAVHVTSQGWEIVDRPPILFRRYSHQQPQVEPVEGGDIVSLANYFNLRDVDIVLVFVYLVTCFIPRIAHPILVVCGPTGSTKTMLTRMLRMIVDPSALDCMTLPRNERELVQQLYHNWASYYDNVGALPRWISDALCRASTGGGFSKRELYTDDDDVICSPSPCVAVNGINVTGTRPDFLDRSVIVRLDPLPNDARKTEKELLDDFRRDLPSILAAIFGVLSKAIAMFPSIKIKEPPRMADFAAWGSAVAEAIGFGQKRFLDAYQENVRRQVEEATSGSLVAQTLLAFMDGRQEWIGTASTLLTELEIVAESLKISTRSRGWPKAPHSLSRRLNELKPSLLALHLEIDHDRRGSKGERLIWIRRKIPQGKEGPDATDASKPTLDSFTVRDSSAIAGTKT